MRSELSDHVQDRFDQLVELKQNLFRYQTMCEAVAAKLEDDRQFRVPNTPGLGRWTPIGDRFFCRVTI